MAKSKVKRAKFKIQRRLLCELPGLGKSGALDRRPYPPGQHGNKRKKYSDFSLQLMEKQKVLFHYGLREKQLRHFSRRAQKGAGSNWTEKTISLLEMRLDNLLFRAQMAPSIPAAKQMCSHGQVLVNGKKLDIKSAVLKIGDEVSLVEKAYKGQSYLHAQAVQRLEIPDYMKVEERNGNKVMILKDVPSLHHIPFPFEANQFTEYYSIRG